MNPSHRIEEMKEVIERYKQRAEIAEAKLAELAKQEPVFLLKVDSRDSEQYQFDIRAKLSDGVHELFTRPAPAVDLTELVPNPSDGKYWANDGYGTRFKVQTYYGDIITNLRKESQHGKG